MYIAAQALGLAVTVLRIGNIDKNVDAVSAASARKKPEEVVNYK
jgi:hypothetical protein